MIQHTVQVYPWIKSKYWTCWMVKSLFISTVVYKCKFLQTCSNTYQIFSFYSSYSVGEKMGSQSFDFFISKYEWPWASFDGCWMYFTYVSGLFSSFLHFSIGLFVLFFFFSFLVETFHKLRNLAFCHLYYNSGFFLVST